jgi:hypothetical protein
MWHGWWFQVVTMGSQSSQHFPIPSSQEQDASAGAELLSSISFEDADAFSEGVVEDLRAQQPPGPGEDVSPVSPMSHVSWELLPGEQPEAMAVAKATPGASNRMSPVNGGPDPQKLNLEDFKPVKPWITRDQTCKGPYKLDASRIKS